MHDIIIYAVLVLAGAALTAFVTWVNAARRVSVQIVTQERAQWRRVVRRQSLEVHDAILKGESKKVSKLKCQFQALLNPHDPEDRKIVCSIKLHDSVESRKQRIEEFTWRITLLLKHDWERAKLEAGFFLCRWILEPNRTVTKSVGCEIAEGIEFGPSGRPPKYTVRCLPTATTVAAVVVIVTIAFYSI